MVDLRTKSIAKMTGIVSFGEPLTVTVLVPESSCLVGDLVLIEGVRFELRREAGVEKIDVSGRFHPVAFWKFEASIFYEEDLRERALALQIAERSGLL